MGWWDTVEERAQTSRKWWWIKQAIAWGGCLLFIAFCSYDWETLFF